MTKINSTFNIWKQYEFDLFDQTKEIQVGFPRTNFDLQECSSSKLLEIKKICDIMLSKRPR